MLSIVADSLSIATLQGPVSRAHERPHHNDIQDVQRLREEKRLRAVPPIRLRE